MMEFLMKKPRNRNDNSYNTKIQKGQVIETSNLQVSMKEVDSKPKKQKFKKKNKFEKINNF